MLGVGTRSERTETPQKVEKPSFASLLEAKIKQALAGGDTEKAKKVNVNDVAEFKGFLNNVNNWILNSEEAKEYSLEERKTAVAGASNGAKSMSQIYFEAKEGLKGRSPHESLIHEAEETILKNIETTVDNLSYTDHLSVTDKVTFIGLNENQSLSLAKAIDAQAKATSDTQSGFSKAEQKVALYEVLETAAKAESEVQESDPGKRNTKKAEVFQNTLNQAFAKNSHKFSKEFLNNSAQELTNNAALVGTTKKMALVNKKNPDLISYITGGSEKALTEIGAREKAWGAASNGLSAEELQDVVDRANTFILSVKGLDLNNKETAKENIAIVDQAQADAMKFDESDSKAEQKAQAVNAYIKLSSAKAVEVKEVKSGVGAAMPDLMKTAVGALACLSIVKMVFGNLLGQGGGDPTKSPLGGGLGLNGGLVGKSLGLLAVGGLLGGLNFDLKLNDDDQADKKTKPPEPKAKAS